MDNYYYAERTKQCKYCRTEIPYNARICPQCKKEQTPGCFTLIINIFLFLFVFAFVIRLIAGIVNPKSSNDSSNTAIEQNVNSENIDATVNSKNNVKYISVNEPYTTHKVTYMVTEAEFGYVPDNSISVEYIKQNIDIEQQTTLRVMFEFTNNTDSDEYVSAGEFKCYANNTVCENKIFASGSYNENISPGRKAIIEGIWIVPLNDLESIELEYDPSDERTERVVIDLTSYFLNQRNNN